MFRQTNRNLLAWGGLTFLYALLIVVLPENTQSIAQYHLSHNQYRLLTLLLSVPLFAIWFAAFYGYSALMEYVETIQESREATGLLRLSHAARWLAWGQPGLSILSLTLYSVANRHSGFLTAAIIIINYTGLLISLFAFSAAHDGARQLIAQTRLRMPPTAAKTLQLLFVSLGVAYCYIVFRYANLQSFGNSNNPFRLPLWLLVTTLLIPYLYAWFVGLVAVYDIAIVAKGTKGVLYRQALSLLSSGFGVVIASSIISQYLYMALPRYGQLLFGRIFLAYLVLFFFAVGFTMIALGAKRLKKIEDI